MYTDDKNAQVVLSLLKQYGIRKIVINPGTTNVPIARSVSQDDFFEVYSIVDERSAAYFAGGLAFASGEPVVISCTGATASRNYLPGLTEAYYRKLPVIALTSRHHTVDYSDLYPQLLDRTTSQNDVKRFDALLPYVKDNEDYKQCVFLVNKALHFAINKGGGPVHIDLTVSPKYSFTTKELPQVQKIDYFNAETLTANSLKKELKGKKVAIFIGAHKPFDHETQDEISEFAQRCDAPVFCDHTSSYKGANALLISVISDLRQTKNKPDLIIDLGSISGDYSASRLFSGVPTWRLSEDGEFHNRMGVEKLEKVFEMSERMFFREMNTTSPSSNAYYSELRKEVGEITIPNLPLSNTYVSSRLSKAIPNGSALHLSILNSLRNMDFFSLDDSLTVSSNVGGFGIDGALSTSIGQAAAFPGRLVFCLIGDLAFFYDMNALGMRHIGANMRILLINNGEGVEFRLNNRLESQWGDDTDEYIAAKGHFGNAELWVKSRGMVYLSAQTKEEFDQLLIEFANPEIGHFGGRSVVFEVFTNVLDEQHALEHMRNVNRPVKQERQPTLKQQLAKHAPESAKKAYRKAVKGHE